MECDAKCPIYDTEINFFLYYKIKKIENLSFVALFDSFSIVYQALIFA